MTNRASTRGIVAALALASVACASIVGADFDRKRRPVDTGMTIEADATVDAAVSPFETIQGKPAGETLLAIWGADAENVFAVGTNGTHYELVQGVWSHLASSIPGRDYTALWGTGATDVYAVGVEHDNESGIIQHFDGKTWRDEYRADTAIYGVWGAEGAVLAVGAKGIIYGKSDGGEWAPRLSKGLPANPSVERSADSPILWSIAGNGPNDFAIAADLDRIFHYAGSGNFENYDPKVDRTIVFRTAFALPSNETSVFFGSNHCGVTWFTTPDTISGPQFATSPREGNMLKLYEERSPGSEQRFIRGIWGTASRMLFVGDLGRILTWESSTNRTTEVTSPTKTSLYGVWGRSPDDVWIVGDRELILHGALP